MAQKEQTFIASGHPDQVPQTRVTKLVLIIQIFTKKLLHSDGFRHKFVKKSTKFQTTYDILINMVLEIKERL